MLNSKTVLLTLFFTTLSCLTCSVSAIDTQSSLASSNALSESEESLIPEESEPSLLGEGSSKDLAVFFATPFELPPVQVIDLHSSVLLKILHFVHDKEDLQNVRSINSYFKGVADERMRKYYRSHPARCKNKVVSLEEFTETTIENKFYQDLRFLDFKACFIDPNILDHLPAKIKKLQLKFDNLQSPANRNPFAPIQAEQLEYLSQYTCFSSLFITFDKVKPHSEYFVETAAWQELSRLTSLKKIHLARVSLDFGQIAPAFLGLQNLLCCELVQLGMKDKDLKVLFCLKNLRRLNLSYNYLEDLDPQFGAEYPHLDSLIMKTNPLSLKGIAILGKMKGLVKLNLSNTHLLDGSMIYLLSLPKLKELDITSHFLSEKAMKEIAEVCQKRNIRLKANKN